MGLINCSKEDDDSLCLNFEIIGESFDQACEGMVDPDSGETLLRNYLRFQKLYLKLLKQLGY